MSLAEHEIYDLLHHEDNEEDDPAKLILPPIKTVIYLLFHLVL